MAWAARDGLRLKTGFPRGIAPATSLRPAEAAGQVDVNYKPLALHSFTVACSIAIATVVAARARARYWGYGVTVASRLLGSARATAICCSIATACLV